MRMYARRSPAGLAAVAGLILLASAGTFARAFPDLIQLPADFGPEGIAVCGSDGRGISARGPVVRRLHRRATGCKRGDEHRRAYGQSCPPQHVPGGSDGAKGHDDSLLKGASDERMIPCQLLTRHVVSAASRGGPGRPCRGVRLRHERANGVRRHPGPAGGDHVGLRGHAEVDREDAPEPGFRW